MRILVTGATGFLGRHVVAALVRRGHLVRALVRDAGRAAGFPHLTGVELSQANLKAGASLSGALKDIDTVVHLAAATSGDDSLIFASTVLGTERLVSALRDSSVRRFVLCSSGSVYDYARVRRVVDESAPLLQNPHALGGYAASKVWQERLLRRASDALGFGLVVLRPGFIWGRGREDLPCLGVRVGATYVLFGGFRRLPLTYVENCADCFACAVDHEGAMGQTFNVIDDGAVRAWKYAGACVLPAGVARRRLFVPFLAARCGVRALEIVATALLGNERKLPAMFEPVRFGARYRDLQYDTSKLLRVLGWTPPHTFSAAVTRTLDAIASTPPDGRPEPCRPATNTHVAEGAS